MNIPDSKLDEAERRAREAIIRPIPGYDGYYATFYGEIYSVNGTRGKLRQQPQMLPLKQALGGKGYPMVFVRRPRGGNIRTSVHSLVCAAYYGPRPPAHEVLHADGVPTNNCPLNLRWGSRSENGYDRVKHERARTRENPNTKSHGKTGLVGSYPREGRFMSRIGYRGKSYYLGDFNTPEEAQGAYLKARRGFTDSPEKMLSDLEAGPGKDKA